MPRYVIKRPRELFGRVYNTGDIVEIPMRLEEMDAAWGEFLGYETKPSPVAAIPLAPPAVPPVG